MSFDHLVNGIARLAIGFFMGMAMGYTAQLAQTTGWWFAVGFFAVVILLFSLVFVVDGAWRRFLHWTGIAPDIPQQLRKLPKPHWFVRYGWIFSLIIGFAAVLILPEEAFAWL